MVLVSTKKANRSLALILDKFYKYMATYDNKKCFIWGDKTPLNVFCLNEIIQVFPKAKFIHIYRDGYDVVSSYLKMGRYNTMEDAAKRWAESTKLCQNLGEIIPNQYMEISYENLVTNHEMALKQICAFLAIKYTKFIDTPLTKKMGDVEKHKHHRNVTSVINLNSIGKGRKDISSSSKIQLQEIMGKQLVALGYKPT